MCVSGKFSANNAHVQFPANNAHAHILVLARKSVFFVLDMHIEVHNFSCSIYISLKIVLQSISGRNENIKTTS